MWGRRGGNPQIARSRSRQRFWHEDGNGVPGGLERSLKMKRLNPDERQRRFESEQAESLRASGQGDMSFQEAPQLLLFHFFQFVRLHEFEIEDVVRFAAQDVGKAAGHPRAKIETDRTKNSGDTAGTFEISCETWRPLEPLRSAPEHPCVAPNPTTHAAAIAHLVRTLISKLPFKRR